jgi:hypothetical protein
MILAEHNVQLLWVPGHKGTEGTETADQQATWGSLYPLTGPDPACGVSERVARDWMCREHQEYWQSTPGQRHAKIFPSTLSDKRTTEFLKLNRSQARQVTGLLTAHCHLRATSSNCI